MTVPASSASIVAQGSPVKPKSNHCIKLRGLPWSSSKEDILNFLDGCSVINGVEGIHMIPRSGPTRGEAFVELESQADVETALSKHRQHMGSRYIEVFTSSATEMAHMTNPKGPMAWRDPVLRLRGIPYYCTKQDIYDFFSGLQIAHNGVYISMDEAGNASGVAFVAFVKMDTAYKALEKHRQMIGHRYVELFQSSYAEARARMVDDMEANGYGDPRRLMTAKFTAAAAMGVLPQAAVPPAPLMGMPTSAAALVGAGSGGGGGGGLPVMAPAAVGQSIGGGGGGIGPHNVIMNGLPYKTSEEELAEFFEPLKPLRITIKYDGRGRPTGEAIAEFKSHDEACEAMKYDKRYIGQRYVDLSLESSRPDVAVAPNAAAAAAALLSGASSGQGGAEGIQQQADFGAGVVDPAQAFEMYQRAVAQPPPHGTMMPPPPPPPGQASMQQPPPSANYPAWGGLGMPDYDNRWY